MAWYRRVINLYNIYNWTRSLILMGSQSAITRIVASVIEFIGSFFCGGNNPPIEQGEDTLASIEGGTAAISNLHDDKTKEKNARVVVKCRKIETNDEETLRNEIDKEIKAQIAQLECEGEEQRRELERLENEAYRDIALGARQFQVKLDNIIQNCPHRQELQKIMDEPD